MHCVCLAEAFARAKAGKSNAARIAMIAMTTSSSISVKAFLIRANPCKSDANRGV